MALPRPARGIRGNSEAPKTIKERPDSLEIVQEASKMP